MIKVNHNAGFFSCCSVRLEKIIEFYNLNKKLPDDVDSSCQFKLYKNENTLDNDITFEYFEKFNNKNIFIEIIDPIYYKHYYQYFNYKTLELKKISPFIEKYFSPSACIKNISNDLISKYNIDINNCVAIYYRGTDKINETELGSFDSYYNKLKEVIEIKKNLDILIQTDSSDFLDYIIDKLKNNNSNHIIIISENSTSSNSFGIHNEKKSSENYKDMKTLFASFLIISKCKYIICGSGNCSIWIIFYRGNADNVFQNLHYMWI